MNLKYFERIKEHLKHVDNVLNSEPQAYFVFEVFADCFVLDNVVHLNEKNLDFKSWEQHATQRAQQIKNNEYCIMFSHTKTRSQAS